MGLIYLTRLYYCHNKVTIIYCIVQISCRSFCLSAPSGGIEVFITGCLITKPLEWRYLPETNCVWYHHSVHPREFSGTIIRTNPNCLASPASLQGFTMISPYFSAIGKTKGSIIQHSHACLRDLN